MPSDPRTYTKYIARKSRAHGPDVFFGPFDSWAELKAFADAHDISVAILQLIDPAKSSPEDWWG